MGTDGQLLLGNREPGGVGIGYAAISIVLRGVFLFIYLFICLFVYLFISSIFFFFGFNYTPWAAKSPDESYTCIPDYTAPCSTSLALPFAWLVANILVCVKHSFSLVRKMFLFCFKLVFFSFLFFFLNSNQKVAV